MDKIFFFFANFDLLYIFHDLKTIFKSNFFNPQNDAPKQLNAKYSNSNKNAVRDKKMPVNPVQLPNNIQNNNITNSNGKRVNGKDNKQFTFKQNFPNAGKLPNSNNNPNNMLNNPNMSQQNYFATNWTGPPVSNSIWSNSSYSEVVAQPTLEPKPSMTFPTSMNGNSLNYRHQDMDFNRSNCFNRANDSCVLEDNSSTQYGPIGTRKSPSSTPSWDWEPMHTGLNQHLSKPLAFNNSNYFNSQQNYGTQQQSKLMNLMSYNDKIQHQQQQQQLMDEKYQYIMMMKERKQTEWLNTVGNSPSGSASSLWSSSTNWASPSPPLSVPPGFEQQFHQQQQQSSHQPIHNANGTNGNVNSNQPSTIPAYDLFKSLSVIWEPSRSDPNNDRQTRNQ